MEPSAATAPNRQFRCVVAAPGLGLPDMLAATLAKLLPDHSVRIHATPALSLESLLQDPELRHAHLVIVLINNLRATHETKEADLAGRVAFVRRLRKTTKGVILITSGIWNEAIRASYLEAGADFAERIPFSADTFRQAALASCRITTGNPVEA